MQELREHFEAFLGGDNAAFAELYRELNPRLAAYCHKLGAPNAEDLVQELWERVIAMRSLSSAKGVGRGVVSPLAFLFRMLRNLITDEYRKAKDEIPIEECDVTDWPERASSYQESLEAVIFEAFDKLAADDKEVLALNIYGEFKFGEIAEMLGKSVDAVWQQASRARTRLRKIVEMDAERLGITLPQKRELKEKVLA